MNFALSWHSTYYNMDWTGTVTLCFHSTKDNFLPHNLKFPFHKISFQKSLNILPLGRSRKDPYPPTEEIFAVRRGREEKCLRISEGGEEKCLRMSEGGERNVDMFV
jgi:hypothetical protein